jgi:hypothetical protein
MKDVLWHSEGALFVDFLLHCVTVTVTCFTVMCTELSKDETWASVEDKHDRACPHVADVGW